MTKKCTKCNIEKPLLDFVKRSNRKNSFQGYCKACHNKKQRSVYRVEYMRNYDLNKAYGIGINEYNEMLKSQGGRCAICGSTADEKMRGKKKYLCVDHCHDSKTVRGLLCDPCNRAIGLLREDLGVLYNAIEYLSKYKKEAV